MKILSLLFIACFSFLLAGCGFHPLSPADFPKAMRTLYFQPENPDGMLATEVRRRLVAANIKLVSHPTRSTITLKLKRAHYVTDQPTVFYSGNAVNYAYTLSSEFELLNNKKTIMPFKKISITRSLLHNANQAYTSGSDVLMLRELTQAVANEIMFNLTSNGTRHLFEQLKKGRHAKQLQSTIH